MYFLNMALEIPAWHMSVMPEAASHGSWSQHSGDTPLDDARRKGHDEIITMLERAESWLHGGVNGSSSVGAALSATNVNSAVVPLEAWSCNENWYWTAPQLCDLLDWWCCMMLMLGLLCLPCFTHAEALRKAKIFAWRVALWSSLRAAQIRFDTIGTTNL